MKLANVYNQTNFKFPDPIDQAQKSFPYTPMQYRRSAKAQDSFLQGVCDYQNLKSGIDLSNRETLKPVTNAMMTGTSSLMELMKDTSFLALMKDKEKAKKFLVELTEWKKDPKLMEALESAKPMLFEIGKLFKNDEEMVKLLESLKIGIAESVVDTFKKDPKSVEYLPVGISIEFIKDTLQGKDHASLEPSPFELVMNDPIDEAYDIGRFGVFDMLDLPKRVHLELNPMGEGKRTHLTLVGEDDDAKQWYLTANLVKVLFENTVIEGDKTKEIYLEIIELTIGDELKDMYEGILDDDADVDQVKDAEILTHWNERSIKFREWIAPEYDIDMVKVEKFLEKEKEKSKKKVHKPQPSTSFDTPSKPTTRSDTKQQQKKELKTPGDVSYVKKEKVEEEEGFGLQKRDKRKRKDKNENMKSIIISPLVEQRLDRMKVLYFSHANGTNNPNDLHEYSAILDSLVDEGNMSKEQRKHLIDAFVDINK